MKKNYLLLIPILFTVSCSFGQVTGNKFIPGDYATLAAAITNLNAVGVGAGGATINVAAGFAETAPAGGYVLGSSTLNTGLSVANTLIIRKNPATAGANPRLTAPVGTSTTVDGIFTLQGTDYTTIDGIDLQESAANTTSTTRLMEWGYGLVKLSAADGCRNNTIINCNITLQKVLLHSQSAIYSGNHVKANTAALTITTASGRNDNNRIYSNTIFSCPYIPINFNGYNAGSPYTYYDQGNDIGGSSAATGNTIIDFGGLVGGSFYVTNFGIAAVYQNNLNVSFNAVTQATDGLGFLGIYPFGTNSSFTCNNNIISGSGMSYASTPSLHSGIYSNASGANLTAGNNNISVTISGSFSGTAPLYGINMVSTGNLTATGNTISTTQLVNNNMYAVYSDAAGVVNISSNNISAGSSAVTSGLYYGILAAATASGGETISNNIFGNITCSNTSGNIYLINASNNTSNINCSNNSVSGTISKTGSGGTFYGYYNYGSPSGGTAVLSGNDFSNISLTGSTVFYGIRQFTATSQVELISNNTISNISGGSEALYGISIGYGAAGSSVNNNIVSGFTGTGAITGIYLGDSYLSTSLSCNNNKINNLHTTGAENVTGITAASGLETSVYKNKIYDLQADNSGGEVYGISITGGTNNSSNTVHNNLIGDLKTPTANSTNDVIRGISITSAANNSDINVYFNSIYLDAVSTGTNFSTTGIYHTYVNSTSRAVLDLRNNIIVNISTYKGSGRTVAFKRSANNNLKNYSTASNNNLFYAGTPGASNLVFYNGNSYQTIAAYKTLVNPSDNASLSSTVIFKSTTGSSADFLHVNDCSLDDKGILIAGFSSDFDAETRSATVPDIGADEFTALSGALAGIASPFTAVCYNKAVVNTGTFYTDASCNLIAKVLPSGGSPVSGTIKTCVTLDATQQYFYGEPYVQRHIDIEPLLSPSTATATVTLYFTNAEFVAFNTNNPAWPKLPTVATGSLYKTNVKVTQFHGTPTGGLPTAWPGNYTGSLQLINPGASNVNWNGSYWEITIPVTGFSGFYVHTNVGFGPLPLTINYFNGTKQGNNHLLNWKVTCNSTPRATMILERSADSRNFSDISSITADALRCNQPFDYTDASPLKGMNYYRLRMLDADGKVTYSSIVALLNAVKGFDIVSIAPNPVTTGNFKLNVTSTQAGKMDLVIIDMQGRIVNRQSVPVIAGFASLPVNVNNLAAGTYTLRGTIGNDQSGVIRFVKQ